MRAFKSSGLLALAAVAALVGSSLPAIGLMPGQASLTTASPAAVSASPSAGTLTLSTQQKKGVVVWNDLRQEFTSGDKNCRIAPSAGGASLLDLVGYMGGKSSSAGFRNGDIGVYEFKVQDGPPVNAAHCTSVDAGSFTATETLGLHLGSDAGDFFGPLTATRATVSLVAQSRDGKISVTLVGAEGTDDVTLPLLTWKGLKVGAPIKVNAFTGNFTGVKLTAKEGGFSLRGATFDLASQADGVLGCEESASREADGSSPGVIVTRLDNADGTVCEAVPYRLRTADQEVQFLKPLDAQTGAQFILDFVWTVSPANTDWQSSAPLLPETTIDYEQDGDEIPLRWCPDVTTDGDGNPTGISHVLTNDSAVDQEKLLDGKQFTCIITQNSTVTDGDPYDYVTVEQQVYLLGDAAYRFR